MLIAGVLESGVSGYKGSEIGIHLACGRKRKEAEYDRVGRVSKSRVERIYGSALHLGVVSSDFSEEKKQHSDGQ